MSSVPEPPSQPSESPATPPGQEDVLGRRISAALIDLALLLGLFVVLALTIGESNAEGGSVSLNLNGADAGLYFALVLLYYFALEAAFGQTVGKLLLGLRVVRPDGSPPSVFAIAVRTLLRIVDWLPLLYLVGFITMMATGRRRLRLGDLAAKTSVGRASPARHRSFALAPVALLLLLIVALSVYRAGDSGGDDAKITFTDISLSPAPAVGGEPRLGGTKTYRAHGISFDYPASWGKGTSKQFASADGETLKRWQVVFVLDRENVVVFRAWKLRTPVTEENFEAAMERSSERLSRYVFTIIDSTAYAFNCQHKRKDAKAKKIDRECDDAQYSFASDAPQFPSTKAP